MGGLVRKTVPSWECRLWRCREASAKKGGNMHRKDPSLSFADKSSLDDPMNVRNGRRYSPNGHLSDDGSATDDSERDDGGMRVGDDYQARIPDLLVGSECRADLLPEKALLVWSPSPDVAELKRLSLPILVDEFISSAKEKYGYNGEQALGMLFWHKHDVEKAIADLPNFTPFPDEWTVEDKVLFEQAFQFHGKSFHRIRQMLPDKSIASLVKYYYSWKKTRCRTSLMDRQARKLANQREEGSEIGSEVGSNSESEQDAEKMEEGSATPTPGVKTSCSNCNSASTAQLHPSPKGGLCNSCHQNMRRSGNTKPATGAIMKKLDNKDRHNPLKSRRKPPRGMHLTYEDLKAIAVGPQGQGDAILRAMDSEVVALRRQVQNNKQTIGALKRKTNPGIEEFRAPEGGVRLNSRWANDELLLAVQGVRKYGKDFKAIAEVIGNKTEAHIRSFFVNYRRRYNLDAVLQEYEAENGPIETEDKPEKMEVDGGEQVAVAGGGGDSPTSPAVPPPPSSVHSSAPAAPPPLLKPAQSPTIMNRSQHSLQTPSSRLANSKAIPQPPPPLIRPNTHPIMAGMRSSQAAPQLSSRE